MANIMKIRPLEAE